MKPELIGNLVGRVKQCNPANLGLEHIRYLDISSIDSDTKTILAPQPIKAVGAPSRARQQVQTDDILVSTVRPNLNAVAMVSRQFDGDIASSGFCVLRPAVERVCPGYLFYFIQSEGFVARLTRIASGASYPAVGDGDVLEAEIPLPSLPEQRRIAAQLEAADRLRRTRRYTLELSDSFLPATFRQLFGDSLRELPRWKPVPISELCESITDCVNKTAPLSEKPTPYKMIRTTNVRNGEVDLNTVRYVSEETFKTWTRRSVPQHGDVILTREAPLGEVGILKNPQNVFLGQRLVQYRVNPAKVVPEYLLHALLSTDLQHQLKRLGAGSTVEHIAVPDCETLMVMQPPLTQQQHFATLVTQHERLRATQRESLRQAEHLFQTLLHRAFTTE